MRAGVQGSRRGGGALRASAGGALRASGRHAARTAGLAAVLAVAGVAAFAPYSATAATGSASSAAAAGSGPFGGPQLSGHGVIVNYPSRNARRLPGIQASSYVIADASTGQVLAARDPHGEFRPASTLKVLTAVSLIPLLGPDATTVATKRAASVEPNVVGLVPGHSYKISDLFTALLTISANDAAVALAQATGSFAKGMTLINAEARHLQADDTFAVQPNGLDAPGQHVSAYDEALIARQALATPAFMKYDETISARFPVTAHKKVTLYNQNALLTQYRGGIGGKIGWTTPAGATFIGMARRNGVTLIATLLHCPSLTEINSAMKLLDWGFAMDGKVRPVGTLVSPLAGSSLGTPVSHPTPAAAHPVAAGARHGGTVSAPVVSAFAFTGAAVVLAGTGFALTRRRRAEEPRRQLQSPRPVRETLLARGAPPGIPCCRGQAPPAPPTGSD
jgi:D-alanyl-D-alanine carboxypeptidase (penicillin-binding protein 5/6)